jgi:hypothetical protein
MTPPEDIKSNLKLFDFYKEYVSDYDVEFIAHHYMTQENEPDAYGHILADFDGGEVSIFVYQGPRGGLYWYKINPEDGSEVKTYLTKEQKLHVWSFE